MKKYQLKNLIRESIKELMNEQTTNGVMAAVAGCLGGWMSTNNIQSPNCINGGTAAGQCGRCVPSNAQPGDTFEYTSHPGHPNASFFVIQIAQDASGNSIPCNLSTSMGGNVTSYSGPCDNCCGGVSGIPVGEWPTWGQSWTPVTPTGACFAACPSAGCDNTMAGSCAQNWLPPNLNWPNMANFACTGNQTYSGVEQNQLNQATNLLNQNGVTNIPSFNNYQDISNFVNGTGIGQPQKGQIKRKLAKSYWGGCMFNECNC